MKTFLLVTLNNKTTIHYRKKEIKISMFSDFVIRQRKYVRVYYLPFLLRKSSFSRSTISGTCRVKTPFKQINRTLNANVFLCSILMHFRLCFDKMAFIYKLRWWPPTFFYCMVATPSIIKSVIFYFSSPKKKCTKNSSSSRYSTEILSESRSCRWNFNDSDICLL